MIIITSDNSLINLDNVVMAGFDKDATVYKNTETGNRFSEQRFLFVYPHLPEKDCDCHSCSTFEKETCPHLSIEFVNDQEEIRHFYGEKAEEIWETLIAVSQGFRL